MKNYILTIYLFSTAFICCSQTDEYIVTKNWIKQHGIKFNDPDVPDGYTKHWDCDSAIAFKKVKGDTIIFLTSRSYRAYKLPEFIERYNDKNYNKAFYPKRIQNNGTIIVTDFSEKVFVFRNDSLFLRDENRDFMVNELIKNMELIMSNQIDSSTYEKNLAEARKIQETQYRPKFKFIFHKDLFKNNSKVKLSKKLNFKEETVELLNEWVLNGKTCYRILLHTNTAGDYVFTSDMKFLDMEGCVVGRK